MKKTTILAACLLMLGAASASWITAASIKLPKCSSSLCRDTGCPADVLCVSGAHVKTCAEWCGGK